jgi:Phosphotransferase enzyme family
MRLGGRRRGAGAGRVTACRSPGLRLIAPSGRLVTRRPLVLAATLAARAGLPGVIAIWPSAAEPMLAASPREARIMRWLDRVFPWLARPQRLVDVATWHALRSRAAILAGGRPLALDAAEHALGEALRRPRLALFSPSRSSGKVTCFVFAGDAEWPVAVVKAMAQREEAAWLAREVEVVAGMRARLGETPIGEALPPAPLLAGPLAGDWIVVEPFDPLASAAARPPEDVAISWLRAFQRATTVSEAAWDERDEQRALDAVEAAWQALRPHAAAPLRAAVAELLAAVRGVAVPRCAVHGDYWRGNLAVRERALRVFDWEWGAERGDPFLDRWCLELCELHPSQVGWEPPVAQLQDALARMRSALARDHLDPAFALATLAPVVAVLARRHRSTGTLSGWGARALPLMRAAERLLLAPDRAAAARAARKFDAAPSV